MLNDDPILEAGLMEQQLLLKTKAYQRMTKHYYSEMKQLQNELAYKKYIDSKLVELLKMGRWEIVQVLIYSNFNKENY